MYPSTTGTICILYKKRREEKREKKKEKSTTSLYLLLLCNLLSLSSSSLSSPTPFSYLFPQSTTTPVTRPCEKRAMTAGLAMYSEGTSKASNISSHIFSRFCRVMSGSSVRSICKKKEKKRKEKKRKENKRK